MYALRRSLRRARRRVTSLLRAVWEWVFEGASIEYGIIGRAIATSGIGWNHYAHKGFLLVDNEEQFSHAEQFKNAIGEASMDIMEIMDDDLAAMISIFYGQCSLLAQEFRNRGVDQISTVQIVVSHCAGAVSESV